MSVSSRVASAEIPVEFGDGLAEDLNQLTAGKMGSFILRWTGFKVAQDWTNIVGQWVAHPKNTPPELSYYASWPGGCGSYRRGDILDISPQGASFPDFPRQPMLEDFDHLTSDRLPEVLAKIKAGRRYHLHRLIDKMFDDGVL